MLNFKIADLVRDHQILSLAREGKEKKFSTR